MDSAEARLDLGSRAFSKILNRRIFQAGDVIFEEGDSARDAYIILRGEVAISTNNKGENVTLTILKKGQMFGELALMSNSRRTATATAREVCEVAALSQDVLRQKLEAADPLLQFWIGYLADRVIALSKRVTAP
jgi:CRP/FNR family cyclic AMP-dependent transcriptional regulator